ncbi:MAG: MogA/MoaB family molybdenum cofactor biosynthesis protein [Gemmatimonadetes bacterium]|nr:MogA/MoaB family molybdenum cofactor biosynthesis protein [Gemmatimonadota bacterium]
MSYAAAVVTVSDRSFRGEREDASGPALAEALTAAGFSVAGVSVVPDERDAVAAELRRLADTEQVPLVLTTGGTGFAPRDITPEATRDVIEKEAPGLAEHGRAATLAKTRFAVLSRGIAGIRGRSLILNLPGSPKGAREMFDVLAPVLPHALKVLVEATDEHPAS